MQKLPRAFAVFAVAAVAVACKKESSDAPTVPATAEIDALWALAPANARGAIVASSKAIGMTEDALAMLRGAIEKAPELLPLKEQIDTAVAQLAGSPTATLADLGLSRQRGAAIFAANDGEMLAIVPVADRDKFLGKVGGTKGATPADPDTIGDITCRLVQQVYACAKPAALLETMGKGDLASQLAKLVSARGDIELVGVDLLPDAAGKPMTIGQVIQLERGGATIRGSLQGVPADFAKRFATLAKPRPESSSSVSFAVIDLKTFLADVPIADMFGPELAPVVSTVAGPITVTVPAGEHAFDARIPIADAAVATKLIESCTTLPGVGASAKLENGICHVPIPNANLELDLWLEPDKKTLRLGKKKLKTGPYVPITRVGRELANGQWALAFWGRGTVMGASQMPGVPGTVDPQTAVMLRALSVLNEIGLGVRVKADKLDYVGTLRTIFANPDVVIARILQVTPDDIAAARAGDKAASIAKDNSAAPFAQDFKAGQMGLAIPYMMMGTIAAIAVPAFMRAMRPPEDTPTTPPAPLPDPPPSDLDTPPQPPPLGGP